MALFDLIREKRPGPGRTLMEIPASAIVPNPAQPRKSFDEESIAELARSIEQLGLIQPLVVRKNGGVYELISGERRLRAIRSLGMKKVLCIVESGTGDAESALMAVVENLQREDLGFFEEAECYKTLTDGLGLTQEELAARIGKSQSFIANKLRLLRIEPNVREAIDRYGLTERHARAVLRLRSAAERMAVVMRAGENRLSVNETEHLVEKKLDSGYDARRAGSKPRPVIVRLVKDYRVFLNTIDAACDKLRSGGTEVSLTKTDREDGLDLVIRITAPKEAAKRQ